MTDTTAESKSLRLGSTIEEDLHDIACAMVEHGESPFVRDIGRSLLDVEDAHTLSAGTCKDTPHQYTDYPCEDFEQALRIGISWLLSRFRESLPMPGVQHADR